jgi:hypothetical protein
MLLVEYLTNGLGHFHTSAKRSGFHYHIDLLKHKNVCQGQGDQIGQISAYWDIVFLWQFCENYRPQIFELLFSAVKVMHKFKQKCVGLHFGRFFHKLIWSPWPRF